MKIDYFFSKSLENKLKKFFITLISAFEIFLLTARTLIQLEFFTEVFVSLERTHFRKPK